MIAGSPIRVTYVLTHPVQYYSPWFRHLARHAPELALTVLYGAAPDPDQQGAGFGVPFTWDVPLTEGYDAQFARGSRRADRFDSEVFRGLDVREIGRALAATRPEVVVLPGWQSITLVRALVAARRLGIPVLYRGDTHLGNTPDGWRAVAWRMRTRVLLAQFSAWLAVGVRSRDYLMAFGVDHRRVFSAPHAVDNGAFAPPDARRLAERAAVRRRLGVDDGAFVVLFAGKLSLTKRPLDLVQAAAQCTAPVTIVFAGAGSLADETRRAADALGVDARTAGFVNQSELPSLYAAADCVAVPSARETWGLVVNEAFAAGVPVVASDGVGCVPDLIDDSTGTTFPAGDTAALAHAIDRIHNRRRDHDYRAACQTRIARFSYDRASAGLIEACRAVTAPAADRHISPAPRIVACCGQMVTVSGLERHTFETLRVLRDRGAAVHVIVNSWEHHRITPLAEAIGATWSVGPYRCQLRRRGLSPRVIARMVTDVVGTSRGLLRDVRRTAATAVLVPDHGAALRNAPALAWLRTRGIPVVMQLGNAPESGGFYRWYWRWVQNAIVSRFVCNSEFTHAELVAHGIPERKTSIVYNVLPIGRREASRLRTADRVPGRIVYVGQIIPGKGLDLLVDAIALLASRGRDATLDVVGAMDGWTSPEYAGFREAIRARAGQPDLAQRIRFLGWREDVMPLLARASVHCAPSRPELREGFGFVNLEAKSVGVPSIVFGCGAFPELITHKVDGWICPEATAAALAEGLEYFLGNPARLQAASVAALESAMRFDPVVYADHWWAAIGGSPLARAREVVTAVSSPAGYGL